MEPRAHAAGAADLPVVAVPGYQVSVFAKGTPAYSHPDSLVADGQHVFVGYQNITAKDGSDHLYSTVAEYSLAGALVHTFRALGHCDGLRVDPSTHLVWALTDEDGNPHLTIINPTTAASTLYQFPATPHGGGFDDMAFTNGMAFIDASNPTLDKNGVNVFPALYKIALNGSKVKLTPVLMGNASSLDIASNKKVTLNLIDPDSITIDPQGNLVLDNQGGSQLVFIAGVGTPHQYVTSSMIGNQMDDTVWATSAGGRLLVSDTNANTIFQLRTAFVPGTVYGAAPNDSGVGGFVGTVDFTTGFITPIAVGLISPHGELFLQQ
jgi:hypothetical protein